MKDPKNKKRRYDSRSSSSSRSEKKKKKKVNILFIKIYFKVQQRKIIK